MILFIQKHSRGLFCALVVGLITVLPQLLIPHVLGREYQGMQPFFLDDEDIYRARIHEVIDGHPGVASPYFLEYKNAPIVVPAIHEWVYAFPALLFGLSGVIVVSKFILPALLFFLVYLLICRLTTGENIDDAELAALGGAFLVTLGTDFVDIGHVINVLSGHAMPTGNIWTRIVNPIMGAVEVFGFLLLLHTVFLKGSRWATIAAGVLLAAMVGYFFSFGISLAILGVALVAAFLRRKWPQVRELSLVLFVSVILDIPYWYATFGAIGGEAGAELAGRNGMSLTHAPIFNKFLFATIGFAALSFVYSSFIKKDHTRREVWGFLGVILAGSLLAFNQQILTGREVWYHHFVQYVIPLCFVAVVVSSFYSWRKFFPKIWHMALSCMLVASVVYGVFYSLASLSHVEDFRQEQSYAPVINWLEGHAAKDCVVLVYMESEKLERLIPAYTGCNVYRSTYTFIGVDQERITHNFLLRLRMQGVPTEGIEEYLFAHETDVRSASFENWKQLFGSGRDQWLTDQVISLAREYTEFVDGDLKEELLRYRMDYLISDTPLSAELLHQLPGLMLIDTAGTFSVYAF